MLICIRFSNLSHTDVVVIPAFDQQMSLAGIYYLTPVLQDSGPHVSNIA